MGWLVDGLVDGLGASECYLVTQITAGDCCCCLWFMAYTSQTSKKNTAYMYDARNASQKKMFEVVLGLPQNPGNVGVSVSVRVRVRIPQTPGDVVVRIRVRVEVRIPQTPGDVVVRIRVRVKVRIPQTPGDVVVAVAAVWLNGCAEARVEPRVCGAV